jgi:hypothetical protein
VMLLSNLHCEDAHRRNSIPALHGLEFHRTTSINEV